MIPLSYIVVVWLFLLVVYVIFVLLTLSQMLKHGTRTPTTVMTTFLFIGVAATMLVASTNIVLRTNWNQPVQLIPSSITSMIPGFESTITDITLEP